MRNSMVFMPMVVTPISDADGLRFRHGKQIVESVIDGVCELVDESPTLGERFDRFNGITLDRGEQELYARTALELRYGEDWEETAAILPSAVLTPRRSADVGDSLWLTMNRVQENLLRGGLRGRARTGRLIRTRGIKSVHEDVRLNRALWRMTDEFAALKTT